MIPYGRQNVNQNDIDAVVTVLKSPNLTQGYNVPEFEQKSMQLSIFFEAYMRL